MVHWWSILSKKSDEGTRLNWFSSFRLLMFSWHRLFTNFKRTVLTLLWIEKYVTMVAIEAVFSKARLLTIFLSLVQWPSFCISTPLVCWHALWRELQMYWGVLHDETQKYLPCYSVAWQRDKQKKMVALFFGSVNILKGGYIENRYWVSFMFFVVRTCQPRVEW
jgi:hypothetical protein